MKYKVTVIIPIYNSEKTLRKCLDSVFGQDLDSFFVICINDGSSDFSLNILNEYKKQYSNLFIVNQKNKGQGYCRNKGIRLANSEFICFMDSDDFYPSNDILSCLYNNAILKKCNVVGGSWSECEKDEIPLVVDYSNTDFYGYTFKIDSLINYQDYQFDYGYHRFLYNLKFLKKNKLFFPKYKTFEDPPFFVKTMIKSKYFYALKKNTYCYRLRIGEKRKFTKNEYCYYLKGLIKLLILSSRFEMSRLHYRTIEKLNNSANLILVNTITNCRKTEKLLVKANSIINHTLLQNNGYDFKKNYVINPLKIKDIKVIRKVTNANILSRFVRFYYKFGFKKTLKRIIF